MTFTEAAIEVLRREGKPLHFRKLTEIAIRENLLDHVGKVPDDTMAGLLAAHCRLPRPERRLMPVQLGTFALSEWGLEEDPAGLDGIVEAPPEDELPYRGRERHPTPSRDLSRGGRGERGERGEREQRPRRHEEERRGRRFPPPSEVAYEILAGAGKPLPLSEIAITGAERLLMPDAFLRDAGALRSALDEDNRRREGAGRKPLFQVDGDLVTLVAQPEPGERPVPSAAPRAAGAGELRRSGLAALRRRLRECDGPTVEHVTLLLLEKLGFRDVKVAKRGREHVVCTAKKKMGLADVRHAVRILRSGADAARRDVSDLRRDLGHYGAQIGVVVTAGDAAREARGDAVAAGQLPVVLLCGEGLAEALAEVSLGCIQVVVPEVDEAFFLTAVEQAAREEEARRARREERDRREGERPERGDRPERAERREREAGREEHAAGDRETRIIAEVPADRAEPAETPAEGADAPALDAALEAPPQAGAEGAIAGPVADVDEDSDADDEGEDEGPEAEGAEEGAPAAAGAAGEPGAAAGGERRRRRRRRRRRGGRGRGGREGAPGQPGGEGGAAAAGSAGGSAAAGEAPEKPAGAAPERAERAEPPPLPPPPREPTSGEGA
jgi:hypothetical protein